MDNYLLGYTRGYLDGFTGKDYEKFNCRASYSGDYDYGYSVGYEDGIFKEIPDIEITILSR